MRLYCELLVALIDVSLQANLPPVSHARTIIAHEIAHQQPQIDAGSLAKRIVHIAINAPHATALKQLTDPNVQPGPAIGDLLRQLRAATEVVCDHLAQKTSGCKTARLSRALLQQWGLSGNISVAEAAGEQLDYCGATHLIVAALVRRGNEVIFRALKTAVLSTIGIRRDLQVKRLSVLEIHSKHLKASITNLFHRTIPSYVLGGVRMV